MAPLNSETDLESFALQVERDEKKRKLKKEHEQLGDGCSYLADRLSERVRAVKQSKLIRAFNELLHWEELPSFSYHLDEETIPVNWKPMFFEIVNTEEQSSEYPSYCIYQMFMNSHPSLVDYAKSSGLAEGIITGKYEEIYKELVLNEDEHQFLHQTTSKGLGTETFLFCLVKVGIPEELGSICERSGIEIVDISKYDTTAWEDEDELWSEEDSI